ncbi:MAG: TOBE domain-containing protein [Kiloniellaceae bacterium]
MNGGRFEQIGPPKELYDNPVSSFVAGFVGDSNRWAGKVGAVAEGVARVALAGGDSVLVDIGRHRADTLSAVEVFVRPEAITIGPGNDGASLSGTVDSLLFNGANSRILVRTASGRLVEVADQVGVRSVAEGDTIQIGWPRERALCFPVLPA